MGCTHALRASPLIKVQLKVVDTWAMKALELLLHYEVANDMTTFGLNFKEIHLPGEEAGATPMSIRKSILLVGLLMTIVETVTSSTDFGRGAPIVHIPVRDSSGLQKWDLQHAADGRLHRRMLDPDLATQLESDLRRLHAENSINHQVFTGHQARHADKLKDAGISVGDTRDEIQEYLLRAPSTAQSVKDSLFGWRHASAKLETHSRAIKEIEEAMLRRGFPIPKRSQAQPEHALVPISDFRLRRKESGSEESQPQHRQRRYRTVGLPLDEPDEGRRERHEAAHVGHAWTVPVPVVIFEKPRHRTYGTPEGDEK